MIRILTSFRRDWVLTGAAGTALLVLFLGVLTNRYRLETLFLRPHPEHFALVIAIGALVWLVIQKRTRIRFQLADLLLGAYLGIALVSALLFPLEPRASVQYWARMFLSILVYFVARWLMSGAPIPAFRLILKALFGFGVLEALFGIVSWFLYPSGINLGVDEYPLGIRGPGGILCNFSLTMYGTLWEPNVFGSTLMLVVLSGATLFVSTEFASWRKYLGIALVIMLVAMGLNASRGALLSLLLGMGLVVLIAGGMSLWGRLKWAGAALVLVLVVNISAQQLSNVLMQLPSAPGFATRAPCAEWIAAGMPRGVQPGDPELDPDTGPDSDLGAINRMLEAQTLQSRWVSYRRAWNDFLARPILGNGPNSFGQKYTTTAHTPGWISNLVLMSLHDTGVIGTLILLAWFAVLAWRVLAVLRRRPPAETDGQRAALYTMTLALGIGLLCLFAAYQVTTMLWFGLMWYLMAVLQVGASALVDG